MIAKRTPHREIAGAAPARCRPQGPDRDRVLSLGQYFGASKIETQDRVWLQGGDFACEAAIRSRRGTAETAELARKLAARGMSRPRRRTGTARPEGPRRAPRPAVAVRRSQPAGSSAWRADASQPVPLEQGPRRSAISPSSRSAPGRGGVKVIPGKHGPEDPARRRAGGEVRPSAPRPAPGGRPADDAGLPVFGRLLIVSQKVSRIRLAAKQRRPVDPLGLRRGRGPSAFRVPVGVPRAPASGQRQVEVDEPCIDGLPRSSRDPRRGGSTPAPTSRCVPGSRPSFRSPCRGGTIRR